MLCNLLFAIIASSFAANNAELAELRNAHKPNVLTNAQLHYVAELSNVTNMNAILDNICIPRVVGSPGHNKVHDYIVSVLTDLGWDVKIDRFKASVPKFGTLTFRNIIATLNPQAERYLVLSCHYDSKYYEDIEFVGASDSAVPCAMMINLAFVMRKELKQSREDVDLKLVFFDGEEAFEHWGPKDSIYGARHLATKYRKQEELTRSGFKITKLDRIDLLVLLDLLGGSNPRFFNYFDKTSKWYYRLVDAEQRLRKKRLLQNSVEYFQDRTLHAYVEDDHIPFLKRGVPIIHVIPTPFPQFWHTINDVRKNMDMKTTEDLNKILRVFVAEYLHLSVNH